MAISSPEEKAAMKAAEESVRKMADIPPGYIEINLSTKGKIGAPASFHVRNFTTEDLMDLAATEQKDIPVEVVKRLQEIIWEDNVNVEEFHENEVIETLFIIYREFYSQYLPEMPWELTDDDKAHLQKQFGGESSPDYINRIAAYEDQKWVPRWDIDLATFGFYEIPDDFKSTIKATDKQGNSVTYTLPKYGDVVVLKNFIDKYYEKEEAKFAQISRSLQQKNQLDKDFLEGKSNRNGDRIYIPKSEEDEYNEYAKKRMVFSASAIKALHLKEVNGVDFSGKSLSDRIDYVVNNPGIFSHGVFKKVTEKFSELKIGINPETEGIDPILQKRVKVNYTFRVFALLQALRDNDAGEASITFE